MLEYLEDHALYWKKLDHRGDGLGDYGTIENLLEVVSTYLHEVAGMNANNVHSMRVVADFHAMRGNAARAQQLRAEAKALAERINRDALCRRQRLLAMPPAGWHVSTKCATATTSWRWLDNMSDDLSPGQKQEMGEFFWRELHSEKWMRALSQSDADATWNIRPDHSCLGAYAAWPAMTAKGLYRMATAEDLCRG